MYEVTLDEIHCPYTAFDSPLTCLVQVWLDDADVREPYMSRQELSTGESAPPADPFERRYFAEESVTFELEAGDTLSLGEHTVDVTQTSGTESHTFSSGQLEFELEYTVEEPDDPDDVDPLETALEDFRDAGESDLWPELDHDELVDWAEYVALPPDDSDDDLTDDVYMIDQDGTSLCGPTSMVFSLAFREPRRYVEIGRSLYETGGFLGRTEREVTSDTFRESTPVDDIEHLDWLLIGGLRDSKSILDDYSDSEWMESSQAWENDYWIREAIGYGNVERKSAKIFGKWDVLQSASEAVDDGGVAVLDINSEWIDSSVLNAPGQNASRFVFNPNHAISLTQAAEVQDGGDPDDPDDNDEVLLRIHTSRGKQKIIRMEWTYIKRYFFGATWGTPP